MWIFGLGLLWSPSKPGLQTPSDVSWLGSSLLESCPLLVCVLVVEVDGCDNGLGEVVGARCVQTSVENDVVGNMEVRRCGAVDIAGNNKQFDRQVLAC